MGIFQKKIRQLEKGEESINISQATSDKIVDVVDPVWSATVKSIDAANQKVTVTLTATDKYLDTTNTTLVASTSKLLTLVVP